MNLDHKIDFSLLISVDHANLNGIPVNGNPPRTDFNNYGEVSDVCIKRKIRNRMQDMGNNIMVKMEERCDDGCSSMTERAEVISSIKDKAEYASKACELWMDVRTFGHTFTFKGKNGLSVGVRGPMTLCWGRTIDSVNVRREGITCSINRETTKNGEKDSNTIGEKSFIDFGLYRVNGSINAYLAERTGFSLKDAEVVKECIRTLFTNDESSARPAGSVELVGLYWWEHNCKDGQYNTATVHRSLKVKCKNDVEIPTSVDDYDIILDELPNLKCEVIRCGA